jgi:transcriptional regulator with XRE-family HTH domain
MPVLTSSLLYVARYYLAASGTISQGGIHHDQPRPHPAPHRGEALRRYRERAGLPLDEAAAILQCDRSKVSRIETGQRGIRAEELHALLTAYGADEATQDALAAVTGSRINKGWWSQYADALTDARREYLQLEATASAIDAYEVTQVPDLLQTPQYARSLAEADPSLPEDSDRTRAVEALAARQQAFWNSTQLLTVVITEAALLQLVGGRAVMRDQLAYLADLPGEGRVLVHLLPFGALGRPAPGLGSMNILHLGPPPGITVTYLADASGGHFLTSPHATTTHATTFEQLRAHALPTSQSAARLSELAGA